MKKYFLTMAVMALFAIGFAASDEDESSSSSSSSPKPQIEQKQETEAERKARAQREEKERQVNEKQRKIDKVKRSARTWGKIAGSCGYGASHAYDDCMSRYLSEFGTPDSKEEQEMYDIFKEEYLNIWRKYTSAREDM